jgi:hypothetical protein
MELKAVSGRVVILVDPEQKNYWTFKDGTTIRYERNFNNLDNKHTQQVLGTVVDAEHIPKGAMCLFHHNCLHPVNEIFNHNQLSGEDIASGVKVISIREEEAYLWKMPGDKEWQPAKNFCIALRVFKPYNGLIKGIEPTKVENMLYIKTGEYAGRIVRTLKACDFPIIFRNEEGVEETIIRCRHFEEEYNDREELVGIDEGMTAKLYAGDLLIGIEPKDAQTIEITAYAD